MPRRGDLGMSGAPARRPHGGVRARLSADARGVRDGAREAYARRLVYPRAETPTRTPDRCARVRIRRHLWATMRDGVRLCADLYEPSLPPPWPVVLIRLPYGKGAHPLMPARGRYWARKGYACVIQDVRGRWRSRGRWEPLVHEAEDGYDTLDWLALQPWCDGRIGMVGESYYGMTQLAVASLGHPNLRCIAPGNSTADIYGFVHPGGTFAQTTAGLWAWEMRGRRNLNPHRFDPWHLPLLDADEAAGTPSPLYKDYVRHWARDAYWDAVRLTARLAEARIPAFHWGGVYDVLLDGSLDAWRAVRHGCPDHGTRARQWLTVAGTDHGLTTTVTGRAGRHVVGDDVWSFDRVARFMDRWVMDRDNGQDRDPAVQTYVVAGEGWRSFDDWPPPACVPTRLYLHSRGRAARRDEDGVLSADPPLDEPPDVFRYDPRDPVTWWLGRSLWELAAGLDDRRSVEARHDVAVYSGARLEAGLTVVGPLSARLHVSSSCLDTDLTVALVDVFPDGHAQLVQEGVRRARFRESDREERLLRPDEVVPIDVDLTATSYRFATGHRLRVEVSSSNFGRWDRNLNTGRDPGSDDRIAVASTSVWHDAGRPSFVTLSVVEGRDERGDRPRPAPRRSED